MLNEFQIDKLSKYEYLQHPKQQKFEDKTRLEKNYKDKYFFKNCQNQQGCCLCIGEQNSGKSYLFKKIFQMLVNKQKSNLFIISSLPMQELKFLIYDFYGKQDEIYDDNLEEFQDRVIIYDHNNKDKFQLIYQQMSDYMNKYIKGKLNEKRLQELKKQHKQLKEKIEEIQLYQKNQNSNKFFKNNIIQNKILIQNKSQNNFKKLNDYDENQYLVQTSQINKKIEEIEELIEYIEFYQENEKLQIKFFIYVDDLIKVSSKEYPFFELILRNYRHLGGVLLYVTCQSMMVFEKKQRELFTHIILFSGISFQRIILLYEQQRLQLEKQRFIEIYQNETFMQQHSYIIICSGNGFKCIQSQNKIYY